MFGRMVRTLRNGFRKHSLRAPAVQRGPPGAEAQLHFVAFAARLKSCPDTMLCNEPLVQRFLSAGRRADKPAARPSAGRRSGRQSRASCRALPEHCAAPRRPSRESRWEAFCGRTAHEGPEEPSSKPDRCLHGNGRSARRRDASPPLAAERATGLNGSLRATTDMRGQGQAEGLNRLQKKGPVGMKRAECMPQGLKPASYLLPLSARLKSCPDTKLVRKEFFRSLGNPDIPTPRSRWFFAGDR